MYALLLFSLRQRFAGYVSSAESAVRLALRILYIVLLLINAALFGWLIDVLVESDASTLPTDVLVRFISVCFCSFWVLLEFFPTYTQRSTLISSAFPIRFVERWSLNLIYDTITATTIGLIVGFCLIDALSNTYTHTHLLSSLLLFANTVVCVQVAKAFVESTHHRRFLLLTIWLVLISAVVGLVISRLPDDLLLISGLGLSLVSFGTLLVYIDQSVIEATRFFRSTGTFSLVKQLSPVYVAFVNNPKSRSAFGFGLLLKIVFLFFSNHSFMKDSFAGDFLLMLYVSPIILFTYVANNIWGFFPLLWINGTLGKRLDSYRFYFQLISVPIILDLIITTIILFYTDKVNSQLLSFYVLSTITLSINGFMFSQNNAFYVHSSLNFGQMKNNVNGWSTFTAFLSISLTAIAVKWLITTILFACVLGVGIRYLYRYFSSHSSDNTHALYEQLFVNRA